MTQQYAMSPEEISVIISLVGVILSVVLSVFIAGTKWGRVESKMEFMSDRLAKIEGMFTLRIRDGHGSDE